MATDWNRIRPSGVPGLVIVGESPWLRLCHKDTGLDVYRTSVNHFRLVRDARAAAVRLADVAVWDRIDFLDWFRALPFTEQIELGRRTVEALSNRAVA